MNNRGKKPANPPRRSRASTPVLPEEEGNNRTQRGRQNAQRTEALRNLRDRVPGLTIPNYIEIIDDDEPVRPEPRPEPVRPRRNDDDDPEEGLINISEYLLFFCYIHMFFFIFFLL
jgi:hypothetical protein